ERQSTGADASARKSDAVDFRNRHDANCNGGSARVYLPFEPIASLFVQRLRVVDTVDLHTGRENNRSGDDGTGERSHTDFVNAGDVLDACFPEQPFEVQHGIQTIPFLFLFLVPLRQDLVKTTGPGAGITLQTAKDRR